MLKHSLFILAILVSSLVSSRVIAEKPKYQTQPAPETLKHFTELEGEWIGTHLNHEGKEETA